jgi:hypothetical protein
MVALVTARHCVLAALCASRVVCVLVSCDCEWRGGRIFLLPVDAFRLVETTM